MKKRKPTNNELAAKFNCHPKTISAWKREGAPLDDPKALRLWLANRRRVPAHLPMPTDPGVVATRSDTELAQADRVGAAAALRRLEQAELDAARDLKTAQAGGDPVRIKLAASYWFKICDTLRAYERAVTQDKRQAGELIERREVENHLAFLGTALRMSFEGALPTLAHDILHAAQDQVRLRDLLRRANWHTFLNSLAAGYSGQLPQWLLDAYGKDIVRALSHGETIHAEAKKFAELLNEAGLASAIAAIRDTEPVPKAPGKPEAETTSQPKDAAQ